MKAFSILPAVLVFTFVFSYASAASAALPGWTARAKVADIRTDDNVDMIWVVLDGNHNISECNNSPDQVFINIPSPAAGERKLSMIMTAMAAGMDIQFWVEACGAVSVGESPIGKNVRIYKN